MVVKCMLKINDVTITCRISAYTRISGSPFKHKMRYLIVSKKNNPLFVREWDKKNLSLVSTVCHHLACLVMPSGDPPDIFFHPTLTLMMDSYILTLFVECFCLVLVLWCGYSS